MHCSYAKPLSCASCALYRDTNAERFAFDAHRSRYAMDALGVVLGSVHH